MSWLSSTSGSPSHCCTWERGFGLYGVTSDEVRDKDKGGKSAVAGLK